MRRLLLLSSLLVTCVGCDQGTKALATQTLAGKAPISFVGDVFRLQYIKNAGAFLGLGAGLPESWRFWIFTVMNTVLIAGLLVYLLKRRNMPMISFIALGLVGAGGVGNLIDRFLGDGRVVDFMNLGFGRSLRTGVFNVADVAIVAGGLLLLASRKAEDEAHTAATTDRA